MPSPSLIFCVPIFNDWDCAAALVQQIRQVITDHALHATVLLIDDGSTDALPHVLRQESADDLRILRLPRNLGHQKAIAIGLAYLYCERTFDAVIVMDGDGEDAPADVVPLLARFNERGGQQLIFAQRARRSEGWFFKSGYIAFKAVHWVLTGRRVEVGNFSILPRSLLERLVCAPELWHHYAAACFKIKLPSDQVPIARSNRFEGRSKMKFVDLVMHGLSAIWVFGDEVCARLLTLASLLTAVSGLSLLITIGVRLYSPAAMPGWAIPLAGGLTLILLNALALVTLFCFLVLNGRSSALFLPLRDYRDYIQSEEAHPNPLPSQSYHT